MRFWLGLCRFFPEVAELFTQSKKRRVGQTSRKRKREERAIVRKKKCKKDLFSCFPLWKHIIITQQRNKGKPAKSRDIHHNTLQPNNLMTTSHVLINKISLLHWFSAIIPYFISKKIKTVVILNSCHSYQVKMLRWWVRCPQAELHSAKSNISIQGRWTLSWLERVCLCKSECVWAGYLKWATCFSPCQWTAGCQRVQ